jgi:hypothetical protein
MTAPSLGAAKEGAPALFKTVQFLAMVLTALTLVPVGAHLASLPNKIDLTQTDYFIAQTIYRGWALFGIVLIGAVLANLALAVMQRAQTGPFLLVVINIACLFIMLVIFFAFNYPANEATNNWTVIPTNWQQLRWQWEIAYAANAVIGFIGFCTLTSSLLAARE